VTDNALDSVTINGLAITAGSENKFSTPLTLSGDSLWITLVAKDSSGNTTRDSFKVRRLGPPAITPLGGALQGSQTVQVTISSIIVDAGFQYSADKSSWTNYTNAVLVSKSQILYAQAIVGRVVSDIDSAIFVYAPNISIPSGAYASAQAVTIAALGSPSIEDSLSTGTSWSPYTGQLTINANTKLFARSKLGGKTSDIVEADYAFAPILSPSVANDTGVDSQVVTVTAPGSDSIQISMDTGTTKAWKALRTGTFAMMTGTLYARAVVGSVISQVSEARVQLFQKPPVISPTGGTYWNTQLIAISSATSGAHIFYTTDGSSPTSRSFEYSEPFLISPIVQAISMKSGMVNSAVTGAWYTINTKPPPVISYPFPPTFTPDSGTYSSPQSITISCASSPVTIQYSTDGTTWHEYVTPVLVSTSETLYARATLSGEGTSTTTGTYVIIGP
jgi:hypothetical protein